MHLLPHYIHASERAYFPARFVTGKKKEKKTVKSD